MLIVFLLLLWFICDGGRGRLPRWRLSRLFFAVVQSTRAKLVDAVRVHSVDPPLVQVNEEHYIC